MIRIRTIHIEEFRGIKDMVLNLGEENFAICGPNGTGKSGVVDAIEFCLTGDVTRLSGQGTGDLSVKLHGPHVDQQTHPEKSNVTITANIPSLSKTVTIHRSAKNPTKVNVEPSIPDVLSVVDELRIHPEFALSRREVAKYIVTPPGQRSQDVRTLLKLEHLEKLRKALTTFDSKCFSEAAETERNKVAAESDLTSALSIPKADDTLVLEKINEKRLILGLDKLNEIKAGVSFKFGLGARPKAPPKQSVNKSLALTDLSTIQAANKAPEPSGLAHNRNKAATILKQLRDDQKALLLAQRYGFIKAGIELVTENACPLCDKEWSASELRGYLQEKLLSGKQTEELLLQFRLSIGPIFQSLSTRITSVEKVIEHCSALRPPIEKDHLEQYVKMLKDHETALNNFQKHYNEIDSALNAVEPSWWGMTHEQQDHIDQCETAVNVLPDASPEDQARDLLTIAQERYDRLISCNIKAKESKERSEISKVILSRYNSSCTSVLDRIYERVAETFSSYYRVINHEDEGGFVGKLISAPAKLCFDVDFYGRGFFPPGAYHSEGHQDGMGLCLYLALMKHTLGDRFTFAVLDDVLMSVDTGHRREVCRLLKSEFPKTQFMVTTHDKVWLQYMKTEGLISRSQTFGGWTVDAGPRIWEDHDIWAEIENELLKNDVPKAAWLLRRYLEYMATILADNLRSRIEFRGDAQYDLGDLLPQTLKEWVKKLEVAEKAASSWGKDAEKEALFEQRQTAKDLIQKTKIEEWAINPSVHFNKWANFEAGEFRQVTAVFKTLLESLRCNTCKVSPYVLPRKGKPEEELRCNCSSININLKVAPKT